MKKGGIEIAAGIRDLRNRGSDGLVVEHKRLDRVPALAFETGGFRFRTRNGGKGKKAAGRRNHYLPVVPREEVLLLSADIVEEHPGGIVRTGGAQVSRVETQQGCIQELRKIAAA